MPEKVNDSISLLVIILLCIGFVLFIAIMIRFILSKLLFKRHIQWQETLSKDEIKVLQYDENILKENQTKPNKQSTTLVTSSSIPLISRVLIPCHLSANTTKKFVFCEMEKRMKSRSQSEGGARTPFCLS